MENNNQYLSLQELLLSLSSSKCGPSENASSNEFKDTLALPTASVTFRN